MRTPVALSLVLWSGAQAVLQAGCRSHDSRTSGSEGNPAALTSASPAPPSLRVQMHDHDVHALALRDAIARADLDVARREATTLADLRVDGGTAPAWRKQLAAMNAAATKVAQARDLGDASRELAALARTCGDCHATLGGGPRLTLTEAPEPEPGVAPRMARHRWAADHLWQGLVMPSDRAWRMGARVLTDAPLEPELLTPGKSPVPAIGTLSTSVHELGRKASVVQAQLDRSVVYGELMATCSACHARLEGGPGDAGRR